MRTRKILTTFYSLVIIASLLLAGGSGIVSAQSPTPPPPSGKVMGRSGMDPSSVMPPMNEMKRITPADREAAAQRAALQRASAPAGLEPSAPAPLSTPDYFGTTPNWANSPFPASVSIMGDGANALADVTLNGAGGVASVVVLNGGSGYTLAATTVTIIGGGGTGAACTPTITGGVITAIACTAGAGYNTVPGIRKFVDTLPGLTPAGASTLGTYISVAVADTTTYPGSDYYEIGLVQYLHRFSRDLPPSLVRGYVQLATSVVPGTFALTNTAVNGVQTPVTRLVNGVPTQVLAVDAPSYLGPTIVAQKDRPTRIKFTNFLPTGSGGDLIIPTDTTSMGAGDGPDGVVTHITLTKFGTGYTSVPTVTLTGGGAGGANPPTRATAKALLNPATGTLYGVTLTNVGTGYLTAPTVTFSGGGATLANQAAAVATVAPLGAVNTYSQNRATLHLHGGLTPWISDGTPHQWTTPVGENTVYPEGVSVSNVPDMPDPGPGSLTFFYTNAQSARLMFYHDHAYGLTRLNVYAGEAAGYLLQDGIEADLVNGTNLSGGNPLLLKVLPGDVLPLVIQDRTFVPSPTQLATQDPTWNTAVYGGYGNLWFPHVYMTNQNPWDITGANAMGRWDYGPWFWPPFTGLANGPVVNPLYEPLLRPWEPPMIPGTPNPSLVPEGFMDTPVVNGLAYPTLTVDARAYRLRILNAANDRFWNLQLYQAASNNPMWNAGTGALLDANAGEVPMVPAVATPGFPATWPTDGRAGGVPDPAAAGPSWIQIGTEGGLLPAPVVVPPQAVGYNYNRRDIVVLNIQDKSLFLGPAERADVVVDFSQYAGKTLILYNDSPAPVPAFDPRIDYYTGDPDQTSTGGAPSTKPGYGPNTRTIMQIKVAPLAAGAGVSSIAIVNGGTDYSSAPTVAVVGGGVPTVPAAVTATMSVDGVTLASAGSGYAAAPTVDIAAPGCVLGPGCVKATATASIKSGFLTGITITNGGAGYTTAPLVTLTGAATTPATVGFVSLTVSALTLAPGSAGYTSIPDVLFLGGGGYGAKANAVLTVAPYDLVGLQGAFAKTATNPGAFAFGSDPIVVPQDVYNSAYNAVYPANNVVTIQATTMTFTPQGAAAPITMGMGPKAIQELFETDYGRMNAILGVEIPNTNATIQTTIPYGYIDPATELLKGTNLATPIGALDDGTQLWKITHNGVDTHAIHVHLFNVQVINRVGWDGAIRPPDANELGWKETVRMNPLEDIIVAFRPITPPVPFKVPNSIRPMDVTRPLGSTMGFFGVDPLGLPVAVVNQMINFGWEYVWHCHLLGHEENDMMRPTMLAVAPDAPSNLVATAFSGPRRVSLSWTAAVSNALNASNYTIERATDAAFTLNLTTFTTNGLGTTFVDTTVAANTTYFYRVMASNVVGGGTAGYPSMTANSLPTNVVQAGPPAAPSVLTVAQALVGGRRAAVVRWTDNAPAVPVPPNYAAERNFTVQRSQNGGASWTTLSTTVAASAGTGGLVIYNDFTVVPNRTYIFRVQATNFMGASAFATSLPILIVP